MLVGQSSRQGFLEEDEEARVKAVFQLDEPLQGSQFHLYVAAPPSSRPQIRAHPGGPSQLTRADRHEPEKVPTLIPASPVT